LNGGGSETRLIKRARSSARVKKLVTQAGGKHGLLGGTPKIKKSEMCTPCKRESKKKNRLYRKDKARKGEKPKIGTEGEEVVGG